LLIERVERASKTAQALFDRVTSRILAETAAKTALPTGLEPKPFTVVPPPAPSVRVLRGELKMQVGATKNSSRPANKPNAAPVSNNGIPPEIKVTNPKGNREYILLVEDEIQVAEVAAEMLAEEGYKVIVAHDGFEALKIYRNVGKQIGLVILDFFLPVMDGDAVFDELRVLNPEVNVMLSSGFAEQQKI